MNCSRKPIISIILPFNETVDTSIASSSKTWEGQLIPPPLMQLIDISTKQDISLLLTIVDNFIMIEKEWQKLFNSILAQKNPPYNIISEKLDKFISRVLIDITDTSAEFLIKIVDLELVLNTWKKRILNQQTKWTKGLIDPPFQDLIFYFNLKTDVKKVEITDLLDQLALIWNGRKQQLETFQRLTNECVIATIEEYLSEVYILIKSSIMLKGADINFITSKLSDWANNTIFMIKSHK